MIRIAMGICWLVCSIVNEFHPVVPLAARVIVICLLASNSFFLGVQLQSANAVSPQPTNNPEESANT